MKAEIKPRIDLKNRTKLEDVIPLKTPFIINIDPSERCNFRCKFCPTGDLDLMKNTKGRLVEPMSFELYRKIIDDICEFDEPIKVLRLYKDGEPLINKHFVDMIRYAKEKGCCKKVDTTTNASLLTPELSLAIIDAGLDRINISIEGVTREQYKEFSDYDIDLDKLVENIKFFYDNRKQCEMIVKINGDMLSEEEKQKFYDMFGNITDGIYIESIMSCWSNFELNGVEVNEEQGIYKQEINEVDVCPYVFYSFAINPDGSTSSCFLDWARKLILGNVKEQSVKELWESKDLKDLQISFLKGNRKSHPICGDCGQMSHGMPDNIDAFKTELLEKFD